jgi:hypothetical protein
LCRDERVAVGAQLAIGRRAGQHRRRLRERIAAAVLRPRKVVDPNIGRNIEITLAVGVGRVQSHQGLPIFGVGFRRSDLRARVRFAASIELTRKDSGNRVVGIAPGLRRFLTRELLFGMLGAREARRLGKTDIEGPSV